MRIAVAVGYHPLTLLTAAYQSANQAVILAMVEGSHTEFQVWQAGQLLGWPGSEGAAVDEGTHIFVAKTVPSYEKLTEVSQLIADFIADRAAEFGARTALAARIGADLKKINRYQTAAQRPGQRRSFSQILHILTGLGCDPLTVIAAAFHTSNRHLVAAMSEGAVRLVYSGNGKHEPSRLAEAPVAPVHHSA